MLGMRDVARHAGVSVGTVSNAMNFPERLAPATMKRVQDAIDELGFVRNDAARQLRHGTSRAVGLIVHDGDNPFFTELARGAQARARELGLSVLLANSDEDPELEASFLNLFEGQRLYGVLLSPKVVDIEPLVRLKNRGTKLVLVDLPSSSPEIASISVDNVAGGKAVMNHLLEQGVRRPMFVGGPMIREQVAQRLEGARRAAEAAGVRLEVLETETMTVQTGHTVADQLLARPAGERPDAVFAANDLLALGIMQKVILDGNLQIPRDLAIVGYDDIPYSSTAIVPLTSVRQSPNEMGVRAMELLVEATTTPDALTGNIVIEPQLVVRASSKR